MKLYDYNPAPSPRRVRIFLAEKGVDVEVEQIDLAAKAQFDEPYPSINPRCTVPALQLDDGEVLCDNSSIARYLEEVYPEPPLLGHDPVDKALVAEWISRVEAEGFMGVAEALRNHSDFFKESSLPGPDRYAQIPELAARGRARAEAFFKVLDAQLADNAYVAGEHYSAADIAAMVFVDFSAWIKLKPAPELEHLLRWLDAVHTRPSAKA